MPKSHWQQKAATDQFWRDAAEKGKEQFKKQTFDEFDDFFDFKQTLDDRNVTRDDTRGTDIKSDVTIEFLQAVKGDVVGVELNKRVICHSCKGTRAQKDSKPKKCFECGGRGSFIGNYGIRKRCLKCDGAGCIPNIRCPDCEGLGVQRQILREEVSLPGGLSDKQKVKIRYLGHAADVVTSKPGDLLLTINIKQHEFFTRDGKHISSEVPITLVEALKGARMTVQTVDGPLTIQTEPGVSSGDTMTLKHFGVPEFDPPEGYDPE